MLAGRRALRAGVSQPIETVRFRRCCRRGQSVDAGGAEAGVGEGLGPPLKLSLLAMATALVFPLGENLEQQLRASRSNPMYRSS